MTARPVRQLGWSGMPVRVKLKDRHLGHSLRAGQRLATLTATGTSTVRVPVITRRALPQPSFGWRLEHLP